jgi:hypothetical protein
MGHRSSRSPPMNAPTQPMMQRVLSRSISALAFATFFVFSMWLMFRTFSYDHANAQILISPKIWSDFAANLPLIRSFSLGENWPPEYPIFPGLPIQYHFLFFYFVGKLEALGLPIHWALNLPSALGFFLLLAMIYAIAVTLFRDRRIALLSVLFFLFNGSLGFLPFFDRFPSILSAFAAIPAATDFSAMGPWDGGKVLGVWHLNVFINQRHFGVALGLLLAFMYLALILERYGRGTHLATAIFFGILVGLLPLMHKPVTLMFAVVMVVFFLALPYLRMFLLLVGGVSVAIMGATMLLSLSIVGPAGESIAWHPGFTLHGTEDLTRYLSFFWHQFGLHSLLIPLGLLLAPGRVKLFMLPPIILLLIAFAFRFSPDVMANHKFINFSLIMMQMLSAYVLVAGYDLVKGWTASWRSPVRQLGRGVAAAVAAVMIFFMTLSGVIDFFAVANTRHVSIPDVQADPKARWFQENTPRDAVVLNSSFLYHPASIAGRKIFVGWPYFTTTAGYDHDARFEIVKRTYAAEDPAVFCPLLAAHDIGYVTVENTAGNSDLAPMDPEYFRANFRPSYESPDRRYAVYSFEDLCSTGDGGLNRSSPPRRTVRLMEG